MKCKYCDYGTDFKDELIHGLCLDCDRTRNQFVTAVVIGLLADDSNIVDKSLAANFFFDLADAMMAARKGE